MRPRHRARVTAAALIAGALVLLTPIAAEAHSLDSSTISVHQNTDAVDATVSIALTTLDDAMGTDYAASEGLDANAAAAIADYIADHLTVTSSDGTEWAESYEDVVRESIDGIDSVTVEVDFDTEGEDTASFTIEYDAIIEADPSHEAVVVLTDETGEVSTAGVLDATSTTLDIGDQVETGLVDMISLGYHHVLEGADHLLFLITLLLAAPLIAVAGRWRRRDGFRPTGVKVVRVVTAFTIGHSLTLVASALGWISAPTTIVEVLVAASVAVSAIHAMRPLIRNGEELIAAGFGLVHGLAFAGILADLGFDGSLSIATLLAFNVGVELAQLVTVALVFPSLFAISRTRFATPVRLAGAAVALIAALAWILDRLEILANPLADAEAAMIEYAWVVVIGLGVLAATLVLLDRHRSGLTARCDAPPARPQ